MSGLSAPVFVGMRGRSLFTPLEVPGLLGWWKASSLMPYPVNTTFNTWPDSSGQSRNLVAGVSPWLGGDASFKYMSTSGNPSSEVLVTGSLSLGQRTYVIAISRVGAIFPGRLMGQQGQSDYGLYLDAGGSADYIHVTAGGTSTNTGARATGGACIVVTFGAAGGNNVIVRLNGTQVYAGAYGAGGQQTITAPFAVGSYISGAMWGYFFENQLYNIVPTLTNLQKIEADLMWRLGWQGNLPAGHPFKSSAP